MQLVVALAASAAVLALAGYAVWQSGYQCGKMRQRQEEENQAEQETEILMRAAREANRDENLMEQSEHVLRGLTLYQKYGRIRDHRRRIVYVLVNFGTTMEENLYRIYKLRELGYDPYVMVYNKTAATKEIRNLQRWCNNRIIFGKCKRFEDYIQ